MKSVIVFKSVNFPINNFENVLGFSRIPLQTCMAVQSKKIYDYQVLDLNVINEQKVKDYYRKKDGIVILTDKCTDACLQVLNDRDNKHLLFMMLTLGSTNIIQGPNISHNSNNFNEILDIFSNRIETTLRDTIIMKPMDSISFIKHFDNSTLPLEYWDHKGRIRIVYMSLILYTYSNTIKKDSWLCTRWQKYKTSIGHGHLWNYTLTMFWVDIIYNIIKGQHYSIDDFDSVYNKHIDTLGNSKLYEKYYTNELLFSKEARNDYIKSNKLDVV